MAPISPQWVQNHDHSTYPDIKILKFIENFNKSNINYIQKFQLADNSVFEIFKMLNDIKPYSAKELAEKIRAAKEQREIDEELYGPLPEDSLSKLLDLINKCGEDLDKVSKTLSTMKFGFFHL
jgi:hypothetical protein